MASRFHDKWHGANHQSASANGVPDSARDPIASKDFPFNGEFVLNNNPRAATNAEWADQLDSWVLSSDKIDVHTIRSQRDDPDGIVTISAATNDHRRYVVERDVGQDGVRTVEVKRNGGVSLESISGYYVQHMLSAAPNLGGWS